MRWLTDSGSIAVFGHTQTGKTTLARQLHAETNRFSVWINNAAEPVDGVPKEGHAPVSSTRGLAKRMAEGATVAEYRASDMEAAMSEVTDWMFSIAEEHNRDVPLQIVGDEWHEVAPNTQQNEHAGRDSTRKVTKRGQKRNIKGVFLTQDPVSTDKQYLRQTEYTVLFHNHHTQRGSLEALELPFDRAQQLPEYNFLVLNATGADVGTFETDPSYG